MRNLRRAAVVGALLVVVGCAPAKRVPVMAPTKAPIDVKFASVVVMKAEDVKTPGSPGGIEGIVGGEEGAIVNATIGLTGPGTAKSVTTDTAGKFRFKRVKAGDYTLDLQYADAPLALEVTVLKGQTKKLVLSVESRKETRAKCHEIISTAGTGTNGAIEGVIGDQAGQPLGGVTVVAATADAEKVVSSGGNGTYAFDGLAPGRYVVRFSRGERFRAQRALDVVAGTRYRVDHAFDLAAAVPPPPCD